MNNKSNFFPFFHLIEDRTNSDKENKKLSIIENT